MADGLHKAVKDIYRGDFFFCGHFSSLLDRYQGMELIDEGAYGKQLPGQVPVWLCCVSPLWCCLCPFSLPPAFGVVHCLHLSHLPYRHCDCIVSRNCIDSVLMNSELKF